MTGRVPGPRFSGGPAFLSAVRWRRGCERHSAACIAFPPRRRRVPGGRCIPERCGEPQRPAGLPEVAGCGPRPSAAGRSSPPAGEEAAKVGSTLGYTHQAHCRDCRHNRIGGEDDFRAWEVCATMTVRPIPTSSTISSCCGAQVNEGYGDPSRPGHPTASAAGSSTRAGTPAQVSPSGTSPNTAAPMPTLAPAPTEVLSRTHEFMPR